MTEAMLIAGAILGLVGFVVSLLCVAMIAGFLRSTHTVQYLPAEKAVDIPDPLKAFFDEGVEEEKEILESIGKKKKTDPIMEEINAEMEEITKSDALY